MCVAHPGGNWEEGRSSETPSSEIISTTGTLGRGSVSDDTTKSQRAASNVSSSSHQNDSEQTPTWKFFSIVNLELEMHLLDK